MGLGVKGSEHPQRPTAAHTENDTQRLGFRTVNRLQPSFFVQGSVGSGLRVLNGRFLSYVGHGKRLKYVRQTDRHRHTFSPI